MATALLQARRVISNHTSTAAISAEGFYDDNRHHELARCGHQTRVLWSRHHPGGRLGLDRLERAIDDTFDRTAGLLQQTGAVKTLLLGEE
jgi:hypothetical protein